MPCDIVFAGVCDAAVVVVHNAAVQRTNTDAGARGTFVAAAVAAAPAGRPIRPRGTAVPAVRPQVLRAPVQQSGPVRAGGWLRDRRRVRVPVPGSRQRAATARPHRPAQKRLLGRTLEHYRYLLKNYILHLFCRGRRVNRYCQ